MLPAAGRRGTAVASDQPGSEPRPRPRPTPDPGGSRPVIALSAPGRHRPWRRLHSGPCVSLTPSTELETLKNTPPLAPGLLTFTFMRPRLWPADRHPCPVSTAPEPPHRGPHASFSDREDAQGQAATSYSERVSVRKPLQPPAGAG